MFFFLVFLLLFRFSLCVFFEEQFVEKKRSGEKREKKVVGNTRRASLPSKGVVWPSLRVSFPGVFFFFFTWLRFLCR
ncbi:hypothetical protein D6783_01875 [Candidatus Woesearchaeota archaeon]|nr:MAG: hypothetical protein D6783_01875 [Candidatus Woesearchaeota archaeon]